MKSFRSFFLFVSVITLGCSVAVQAQNFRCPDVSELSFDLEQGMIRGIDPLGQTLLAGRMPTNGPSSQATWSLGKIEEASWTHYPNSSFDRSKMSLTEFFEIRFYKHCLTHYMDCYYGISSPELIDSQGRAYELSMSIQSEHQNMVQSKKCTINGQEPASILVVPCKSPADCIVVCE